MGTYKIDYNKDKIKPSLCIVQVGNYKENKNIKTIPRKNRRERTIKNSRCAVS
jgi:hypothetical protein